MIALDVPMELRQYLDGLVAERDQERLVQYDILLPKETPFTFFMNRFHSSSRRRWEETILQRLHCYLSVTPEKVAAWDLAVYREPPTKVGTVEPCGRISTCWHDMYVLHPLHLVPPSYGNEVIFLREATIWNQIKSMFQD